MNSYKIRDYKAMARQVLLGKYGLAIAVCFLFGVISFSLMIISYTTGSEWIGILISVLQAMMFAGLSYFFLNIAKGNDFNLSDLFVMFIPSKGLRRAVDFLIYTSLCELITIGCFIPPFLCYIVFLRISMLSVLALCFILLIISIVIWLYFVLGLSMFFFVILENGVPDGSNPDLHSISRFSGFKSFILESWNIMRGQRLRLLGFGISFLFWWLLSLITCGIGLLWTIPYIYTSQAFFFLDISGKLSHSNDNAKEPEVTYTASFDQYV